MGITERIDAITRISERYLGTVLPAPKSCKIEITSNCNYKCSFCAKSLHNTGGEMDRGLYSRVIREMRDFGVEELGVFYIGESFTCDWLPDAIKEAKDVGYPYVFLTTDGLAAAKVHCHDPVPLVARQKIVQAAEEGEGCRAHGGDYIPAFPSCFLGSIRVSILEAPGEPVFDILPV